MCFLVDFSPVICDGHVVDCRSCARSLDFANVPITIFLLKDRVNLSVSYQAKSKPPIPTNEMINQWLPTVRLKSFAGLLLALLDQPARIKRTFLANKERALLPTSTTLSATHPLPQTRTIQRGACMPVSISRIALDWPRAKTDPGAT